MSAPGQLNATDQSQLLDIAREAIGQRLQGQRLVVDRADYSNALQQPGACFVTLKINGQLRGCIGSLEPYRSLVEDVARNAEAAAFEDTRFAPLAANEFDSLQIDISVLSPAEPMQFQSEADLLAQLRPGVDGLILEDGPRRGTFLPSVWQQLPEPGEFLRQLKRKAGLPPDHWSAGIVVQRYTTSTIGESST